MLESQAECILNVEFNESQKFGFKLAKLHYSSYQNKFLGFASIKVLETRLFDDEIEPGALEAQLVTKSAEYQNQIWKLSSLQNCNQFAEILSVWDSEHNIIHMKTKKMAQENEEAKLEAVFLSSVMQGDWSSGPKQLEVDRDNDFTILLSKFEKMSQYQRVLNQGKS